MLLEKQNATAIDKPGFLEIIRFDTNRRMSYWNGVSNKSNTDLHFDRLDERGIEMRYNWHSNFSQWKILGS